MVNWSEQGHTEKTRQMRALLRDYVLVLKNTGVRHGTEALALLNQGSLQQARDFFEKVVKINPKHFDAFHLLGIIAAQLKDFESADELFDKAIKLNPNNAVIYCNRGNILKELNKLERAIINYKKSNCIK